MKRSILTSLAIVLTLIKVSLAQPAKNPNVQELDANNFSHGVDTYHDSTIIPDGYVQDALNVYFDRQAPIEKRQGYAVAFSSKAYSYNQAWTYTDGSNTTWLIARASDSIIASNLSGTVVRISTVSTSDQVDEINAFGKAYFVDPTQGVYNWDGASTVYIVGSPKGSIITQFHSRVWVSGQAVPNGNLVNGSKFLDGTVWATGPNPNDPVQFTIGLQDNFDNVTALYPFLDTLYVPKYTTIYAIYGFDNTNFQSSVLTRECGCVDKGSIQAYNKGIVFVSLRGLEFYDGYNCNRISDPVKNKIDAAINLTSFNSLSWVQQNQADWNAGSFFPLGSLSTTISPPSLVLSTYSTTDTLNADFSSGSYNNITINSSSIQISTNSNAVLNNSFESGVTTNWVNTGGGGTWALQTGALTTCHGTANAKDGSNYIRTPTASSALIVYVVDAVTGSTMTTGTTGSPGAPSTPTYVKQTITGSSLLGHRIYLNVTANSGSAVLRSDSFVSNGTDIGFWAAHDSNVSTCVQDTWFFDFIDGTPMSNITSGNLTSHSFDTGYSSPVVSANASWNLNTSTPSFGILTAPAPTGPWTQILFSSGNSALANRYVEYTATMTVGASDAALTTLGPVTFNAVVSSGAIKSQIHNLGQINAWGNFAVTESLNSGNIAFSICSSTNSDMSFPTNCSAQAANSQITISTGAFVQVYATFTVTATTQTPTLNSFTVQWFSGGRANPMASAVFDNRYWLSITTVTSDNANDAVIVMNQGMAFAPFDIHAGGLVVLKNSLYHTDSNATGNVYLDNQGYNDNGNAIISYIRTRDYNLGSWVGDTLFDSLWLSMVNLGSYSVSISYALDKGVTDYNLATANQNEFASRKFARIPFPMSSSNPGIAQTVNFKLSASAVGEPFQFEGMTLLYHERPIQE